MARTKLTEQHKIHVVKRLAAYGKPTAIARELAREFGVTVSHQSVREYEPGRVAGRRLAPRWRDLFAQERAAYLAGTAAIGVDRAGPVAVGGGRAAVPVPGRTDGTRDPSTGQTRLTDRQKIYVVRRLAAFDKPGEIREALAREFGVTISIKSVEGYNPCLSAGRHLAQRWTDLFAQAREAYLASTAEIGVTHKAVRIRRRERLVDRAEEAGQFKAASDILDAIAKDVGDLDRRQKHQRFRERGAAAAATIIINGRTAVGPAPEADGGVRKPGDGGRKLRAVKE
jgi:hypothetical protein